ncbi:dihydrodipicolinate synthase family protein [candidate division KSB1 bacterium]|nr:dihydrodipicolinate synthase family protein [candidate division KSB1 bacterium]
MAFPQLAGYIAEILNKGVVIPAHPLALSRNRRLDERRQRALTRYYLDAGAGGIAVGVHTTQFEIRKPQIGLYQPVLELAGEEIDRFCAMSGKSIIKIAGIIGKTPQAVKEATLAARLGYHAGLLSLSAWPDASNKELLQHCRAVSEIFPLVGFYLQPAVGGRYLDVDFWRAFAAMENVAAIKIAPFNRYNTLDVIRGVAESGRAEAVALYTGNDDNIVADLLTEYIFSTGGKMIKKRMVGGLLGHWAFWTKSAVELLDRIFHAKNDKVPDLLNLGIHITDSNAAVFDVSHNFAGCFVGIHEILRRQGLLEGVWTLKPDEQLTNAQKTEIDRIYEAYPDLNDDRFVAENLDRWLR